MASLSQDSSSGMYRIHFRIGERQFQKSLKTKDFGEATAVKGRVELTIRDVERGRLVIPADADPWEFIRTDGKRTQKLTVEKLHTLADLFDAYFKQQTAGAKEANTLRTERIHQRHLLRVLGGTKPLTALTCADVQRYINARASASWRGKAIRTETIKKEVNTLQMVWNRAGKLLETSLSDSLFADLSFPKAKQKMPFQTWQEIEETIARGQLDKEQRRELWECLFLDSGQVEELLDFVRERQRTAYMYPMMVFAAHTGARLAEIIRSRVEDLKFGVGKVIIREKKKSQSSETHRQVPMSRRFAETMRAYFEKGHPGGPYTIGNEAGSQMLDKTLLKAHHTLFKESKWKVLRGFHILRHSFASNLARNGEDQRVIDELMGHHTEAMRKRYRHMFPEQRENAIKKLFGGAASSMALRSEA